MSPTDAADLLLILIGVLALAGLICMGFGIALAPRDPFDTDLPPTPTETEQVLVLKDRRMEHSTTAITTPPHQEPT